MNRVRNIENFYYFMMYIKLRNKIRYSSRLSAKIYGDAWWTFRDSFNHSIKTKLRREL